VNKKNSNGVNKNPLCLFFQKKQRGLNSQSSLQTCDFQMRLYWLKGVPPFLKGNPNRSLAGCFAFAHSGKLLSYLLDRHPLHLLSRPLGHNIEKDPVEKYPLGV
jgi:hypothetical protein